MAKILVPATRLKDIGPLEQQLRLPTAGRIARGMKTVCQRCGKRITDPFFIVGFKAGIRNMIFHEGCIDK